MKKAFSEYDSSKSQTQKTKDELQEIQNKIDEINAKESISPIDAAELAKLTQAKSELETILALQQEAELNDAKIAAKSAEDAFKTRYGDSLDSLNEEGIISAGKGLEAQGNYVGANTIPQMIAARRYAESMRDAAEEGTIEWKNYNDAVDSLSGKILSESAPITEYMQALMSLPEDALTDGQKTLMKAMSEYSDIILKELNPEQYRAIKWEEILNTKELSSAKEDLIKTAKEANAAVTIDSIKEQLGDSLYKSIEETVTQGGTFSMQDFVDTINSEAGLLNMEEVSRQVKERFKQSLEEGVEEVTSENVEADVKVDPKISTDEESNAFNEWFDRLDEECQRAVQDLQLNPEIDTSGWGLEEYQAWLEEYQASTEEAVDNITKYSGELSDLDIIFDADGAFKKSVDEYVKNLDTLQAALDKVNKGEFTMHDLVDLQQEFSELNNYDLSNIGEGITSVMDEIIGSTGDASTAVDEFGNEIEDTSDEAKNGTGIIGAFNKVIGEVGGESTDAGRALAQMRDNIISMYNEAKTAQDILDGFNNYQSTYHGIKSSNTNVTGLSLDEIKEIEKVYKDLGIKFNREDLFVGTATGIRLNTQALKELNEQVENTTLSNLESELDSLRQRQADGETGLEDDIADAEYLIAQYEGMTSAYNNWVKAKSGSDNRDPMFSVQSGMENVDKLIEGGWFGDEEVTKMIDLLLSADQKTGDVEKDWEKVKSVIKGANGELEKYGFKWSDLFTKDDKGNETSTGLFKFLDVLEQAHGEIISTNEDGTKSIKMTGEQLDQLATQFGTSADWLTIILSALADIDPNLHFTVDADTSEAEEDIDTVRRDAEGNPITLDVVAKPVSSPTEAAENAGHNARNAFTFGFGDTGGGNGGGGGSSDTSSGGEEHSVETQEVTVEVKQEPDPLVLNVSVPGADGEGESLVYKLQVEADYGEGGDGLTLKINPPTGDGVTEDGVYTLQTAIAGVANDDGAFTLSVPSPEGAEGDTYTLSVAAGGIADSSGAISLTVNPEGANEDGSFEITVQAANDGKVLVSAVGPDGSDTISAVVEPNLTALGTAISAFQEELNNNPLKVAVEQSTTHQTSSGHTAAYSGRSFGTPEEPSETAPTEIPGKLVIEEVEYNIEEDPEVDGILNVNEVEENIEEQPEIEGSVKATELDVSGIETPSIDADININGGATLTVDSTAVDQAVTDATQTVQGFNGQTGTAILDGDNSSLASSVSESETLVDGLNSKTATPAFSADTSQLDSSVSESEAKVDALDAKTAEPTATLNDQASGVISNISKALTDLDGKTAHTTVVTTHVTEGGVDAGSDGRKFATGTLTTAHASGTAYNVFNYRPAYSNGKVALSKDEIALVNELGKICPSVQ